MAHPYTGFFTFSGKNMVLFLGYQFRSSVQSGNLSEFISFKLNINISEHNDTEEIAIYLHF